METHDIFRCMSALRPGLLWKMYEENNPIPENKLENVHWETSDVVTPTMSEIEEYHNNVFKPNLLIAKLRKKRNIKLGQSDWTQTNDIRLENEEEWVAYRQGLRDLPSLETPIWPEQPQVKIVQGKNIRTELSDIKTELKADLSETKSVLEADLQTTKSVLEADLQTTKEDLQSKATLEDLQTVKTQLQTTNEQNQKLEARIAFLETALISR